MRKLSVSDRTEPGADTKGEKVTALEFWQMLAAMDDEEFTRFAASHFSLTPKPEGYGPAETMSNFRVRVVEFLT